MPNFIRIGGFGESEQIQAQVDLNHNLQVTSSNIEPIQGYEPSDMDDSADPEYYGFTNKDGAYYIMRINVASGAIRYSVGSSGYALAWTNKATESYDYYYTVF